MDVPKDTKDALLLALLMRYGYHTNVGGTYVGTSKAYVVELVVLTKSVLLGTIAMDPLVMLLSKKKASS
jgi:hypothetical protein